MGAPVTAHKQILEVKSDPKDGQPLAKIQLTKDDPEIHGLCKGVFWYSDASSGWICRLI